jgi:diaminohydroxyphosphoribosylaminopyrimidine deaminase / 5-amino-6-(5-phosphoribosylamino)uracil reductase
MHQDDFYMNRCIELARKANKNTYTNPMVGAILVYEGRIIGEGYHERFGEAHAEINAIHSVRQQDKALIPSATLYVSLEPCSHTGKTPPCAHRIIDEGIRKVVIGCQDPNPKVAGNGIKYLSNHGVDVTYPVLETEAELLIAKFKANLRGIPYIILKWAQSADQFISERGKQTWLSNEYTKILTHKWRSEVDGIMVGKNTAEMDNPSLDVRAYHGDSPIRILLDSKLTADPDLKILNDHQKTIIINQTKDTTIHQRIHLKVNDTKNIQEVLTALFQTGITSILVEGGAALLNSFIKSGYWHEARVIKTIIKLKDGVPAPLLDGHLLEYIKLQDDEIFTMLNPKIIQ